MIEGKTTTITVNVDALKYVLELAADEALEGSADPATSAERAKAVLSMLESCREADIRTCVNLVAGSLERVASL